MGVDAAVVLSIFWSHVLLWGSIVFAALAALSIFAILLYTVLSDPWQ